MVMKIAAIIAEYNPFHNGHKYQIDYIRRVLGADYIIAVMSGNFIQRGAPAMMDKFERAKSAISCGIDAVIELPAAYSTACARDFSAGAIHTLNAVNCVDFLCFGCEDPFLFSIPKIADGDIFSSDTYNEALRLSLKSGKNFALSRADALESAISKSGFVSEDTFSISDAIKRPNNILALEYMLALNGTKSSIKPVPIKRIGDAYDSILVSSDFPSATAIRAMLFSDYPEIIFLPERSYLPVAAADVLKNYMSKSKLLQRNDFSSLLSLSILKGFDELENFADSSRELANRLKNVYRPDLPWDELAAAMKTKNYTLTRINRYLTHILLGIKKRPQTASYIRLLGMRRKSSALISHIKKHCLVPLVTSPKELKNKDIDFDVLKSDLMSTDIYRIALAGKSLHGNDYETGAVFI